MLSLEQIDQIESRLQQAGLDHKMLLAELLDHVCCGIESEMACGTAFETALETVLDRFGAGGLEQVQTETLTFLSYHHQSKRMKQLLFLSGLCASICVFFAVSVLAQQIPNQKPLASSHIISGFGPQTHPILKTQRHHEGVDLRAEQGTPIYAAGDGLVKESGEQGNYGLLIHLEHESGYESRYAHLSALEVKAGEAVKRGQLIGYSGNTGLSTGPHLHFELLLNGKAIDPKPIWN